MREQDSILLHYNPELIQVFIPDDPASIFLETERLCRKFLDYSPEVTVFVVPRAWVFDISDMEERENDQEAGPIKKRISVDVEQSDWRTKVKSALLDLDLE